MSYKVIIAVAAFFAAAAILILMDPGSATAQKTATRPEIPSISTTSFGARIEVLSGYLEGTGLSVNENSLLPRRAGNSRLLTIRLGAASGSKRLLDSREEAPSVSLLNTRSDKGPVSRQRNFELATDRIVAFAVDEKGQVLWWDIQSDPRVLRAETADAGGNLTGRTFYRSGAELLVTIPSDPSITSLHIYVPEWNGRDAYSLRELGELDVR